MSEETWFDSHSSPQHPQRLSVTPSLPFSGY